MTQSKKQKLWLAATFVAGVCVLWFHLDDLGSSEFSGGWLTGRIFSMADVGGVLFLVALVLIIFLPRIASAVALVAALSCLPLYLYVVAPGPFRQIFKGDYKIPLQQPFVWNLWAVTGIATLILTGFVSVHSLRSRPAITQS